MKERKQSKILGLMLAFCMVLTMTISGLGALPISAAEGDDTVSFYIGGVQLASYNTPVSEGVVAYYQNGGTVTTAEPDSWNAKLEYNETTGYTLTLNGLQASPSMASSGINDRSCIYMGDTQLPLNIVLNGTNTLTAENDFGRGIYTALSSVNVSGTGSLTMVGNMYGIQATELSVLGGEVEFSSINASCPDTMTVSSFAGSSVKVGNNAETATAWDGTTHWSNYKYVSIVPLSHAHPICGSSHTDIGNHTGSCTDVTWTPVYSEADLGNMTAGGSYYLANDITLTHTLYVSSVNLCLNGFTLERTSSGHAIELNREAIFNLCDCSVGQTGTIDGGYANDYAGIVCYNNNTLNIYGGTITGCQEGAAIGVMSSGTANIYNGNITGNNGGYGGVYCFNGATLNIYGGTITNNTADYAGGGIWLYKSTLNISGNVKISGNTLNGEENNVHIEANDSDPSVITVGALSSNAEIGITLGKTGYKEVGGSYEKYVEFKEGTISTTGAAYIDRFFCDVDGYKVVANGQGLDLVKIIEAEWGASADALTESGTLEAALSAAESSDTDVYIRLQTNAELVRPYSFENGEDVMITLDLNGYDITATLDGYTRLFGIGYVGSGGSTYGNLTLTDTSSGDKGSITVNTGTVYMCDGSTCHIGGGISIVSTSGYALRFEGGTATVEEGGFSVTSEDSSAIYMNGATLNGNNILFTAITNSDNYSTAAICVDQGDVTGLNATVTGPTALSLGHSWYPSKFFNVEITGGTYTGTQYYAIVINNESGENSSLSLKGGTFVADTEADGVINLYDGGSVLNTYGALLAENYAYTDGVSPAAITNETKLSEARTLVVKNKSELPTGKTIISIEKAATNGLVDTYTVTYDDGSTYEFTVTNGEAGQPGENGKTPTFKIETGELKVSYDDGSTWTSLGNVTGTPGATGREVQLQVNGGYIQWKYEGDSAWTNLVSLETLVGSDGREVTFRVEDGYIQWQYVGDTTWTNLIPLVSLTGEKGEKGDKGDDGREVQLQVSNGYIQWRYEGDAMWTDLLSLSSLVGAKGDKGDVGDDGREVTFRTSSGYIQWQYVGDTEWTDLVELATLVGPKGEDGKTPEFKVENDVLYVSYDNGTTWTELGNIGGSDGTDGRNGQDGKTPTFKIENGELKVSYDNGTSWTSLGTVKGADGADGADGRNGSSGSNGKDGKDGITPQLRINVETNEWEVSYDNGITWTSLGVKATGEKGDKGDKGDTGAAGADGKDGIDGKDGVDGKDGAVIEKGTDELIIVAIIIGCVAIAGEIAFLVYAIIKKRRGEK